MPDGGGPFQRRPIPERSTAAIITGTQSSTVATGVATASAGAGPGANKRWWIRNVGYAAIFTAAPAAGDRGSVYGNLVTAGVNPWLDGVEIDDNFGLAQLVGGGPTEIVLTSADLMVVTADARGSSVGLTGVMTWWGWEYDAA